MSTTTPPTPVTKLGFDPGYLPVFEDKLFIEGVQTARRLTNFFVLLLLATVIATYGILSGSTATVIGAMIVAPLMGPIMATTAAVVMGSTQRALRAFALTIVGILTVIVTAYLLSWVVPDITISFTSNGEIASRINPGLYALITALGAGAAGAFIISRAEIAELDGRGCHRHLSGASAMRGGNIAPARPDGCRQRRYALVFDELPGHFTGRRHCPDHSRTGKAESCTGRRADTPRRSCPVCFGGCAGDNSAHGIDRPGNHSNSGQ